MAKTPKQANGRFKFRLLTSQHAQKEDGVLVVYKAGDTFYHDSELDKEFGADKFQRLSDSGKATTVEELSRVKTGRAKIPNEIQKPQETHDEMQAKANELAKRQGDLPADDEDDTDDNDRVKNPPMGIQSITGSKVSGNEPEEDEDEDEDDTDPAYDVNELKKMSVKELKDLAAEDEIDLTGAKNREDILNILIKA